MDAMFKDSKQQQHQKDVQSQLTLMIWDNSTEIKGSTDLVGGFTVTVRTLDMTARGLLLAERKTGWHILVENRSDVMQLPSWYWSLIWVLERRGPESCSLNNIARGQLRNSFLQRSDSSSWVTYALVPKSIVQSIGSPASAGATPWLSGL